MKKVLLVFSLFLAATFSANAQEISDNAIGLRLGDNDGFGFEISYQRKLKEDNRLEVNLGFRKDFYDLKLTGLYEWVWKLEDNFNWYAGAGAGLYESSGIGLFASGVVGIEYSFDMPLQISLDYRPELGLTRNAQDGFGSDAALSVRYQF
ncbi:hypothetical protein [uncultured Polaribacter sp.]|uniref:hypothetical protein n=1 Tax=uncultured Polaribacter sp. TaxID=174711 RepID=UPI00262420FC|nr:hypothetical protein [uncultured Polaribacter sp.]